jgi:A/G-specific adenine glycosylase
MNKKQFTRLLMDWNAHENQRTMPWKGEKDPYKIWLSEIILQQTRVEQGLAYYEKFIRHFPTIGQLAAAPDEQVFKLWEGLGYYTRCKNLLVTARMIAGEGKGHFPDHYETLLALKGVGAYTAAAIASFAYNLPHAVVDGNVFRVLARCFGIDTPSDSTAGKKIFTELAGELLDKQQPGLYNQAIMDFGATVCKPLGALCRDCVLAAHCAARQTGQVYQLPVKEKTIKKKRRWFYYLVVSHQNHIYIRKRTGKDIWQNLHEFVLYETPSALHLSNKAAELPVAELLGTKQFSIGAISAVCKQQLTHQLVSGQFIQVRLKSPPTKLTGFMATEKNKLRDYAFPRFITDYLEQAPV